MSNQEGTFPSIKRIPLCSEGVFPLTLETQEARSLKLIIAGGGTAGHINPGLAIANEIKARKPDSEIIFIGTKKGLETNLVPREGYKLELIKVMGFKRKISFENVRAIAELTRSLKQVKRIIKEFKPDIVIGTGGYVCGPVLYVASLMKIPTLIHEQNVFPGLTNRILSRFVDIVAVNFEETKKYLKHAKNIVHTGNPIKKEVLNNIKHDESALTGRKNSRPLVIIFGGSRGAENINKAIVELILNYGNQCTFDILFATGTAHYEEITKKLGDKISESIQIVPYIYNMGKAMTSADLAVCRAGAITISELTVIGVPSILIPSPYVTANHQEYNARTLEREGACVVILEKDLNGKILYEQIRDLLKNKAQLNKMRASARKMGIINAGEKIWGLIEELLAKV